MARARENGLIAISIRSLFTVAKSNDLPVLLTPTQKEDGTPTAPAGARAEAPPLPRGTGLSCVHTQSPTRDFSLTWTSLPRLGDAWVPGLRVRWTINPPCASFVRQLVDTEKTPAGQRSPLGANSAW